MIKYLHAAVVYGNNRMQTNLEAHANIVLEQLWWSKLNVPKKEKSALRPE